LKTFHTSIYEADNTFFIGDIVSLTVPVFDGEYGVMAMHENLVVAIVPGELRYTTEDEEVRYVAVSDGMMRIENGDVLILVDSADYREDIDEHRAREKEAMAREAMLQKKSMREYALAEASLKRAVSRLKVKSGKQ